MKRKKIKLREADFSEWAGKAVGEASFLYVSAAAAVRDEVGIRDHSPEVLKIVVGETPYFLVAHNSDGHGGLDLYKRAE